MSTYQLLIVDSEEKALSTIATLKRVYERSSVKEGVFFVATEDYAARVVVVGMKLVGLKYKGKRPDVAISLCGKLEAGWVAKCLNLL